MSLSGKYKERKGKLDFITEGLIVVLKGQFYDKTLNLEVLEKSKSDNVMSIRKQERKTFIRSGE